MHFFFDIDFLRCLALRPDIKLDVRFDFIRFFKDIRTSHLPLRVYILDKSDQIFDNSSAEYNIILESIADFPNLSFINYEQLSFLIEDLNTTNCKYFFLDSIDEEIDLSGDHGFFHLVSSKISELWPKIASFCNGTKLYISSEKSKYNFNSWEELSVYAYPINSVLIVDRYLFADFDDIRINLFPMLKNLNIKTLRKRKVDVVIIFEVLPDNINIEAIYNALVKGFDELVKSDAYNFTLIKLDKTTNPPSKDMHYRILYTNFLSVNPGGSFSFFRMNKKGELVPRTGELVNISNFLWDNTRGASSGILKQVETAFNKVVDRPAIGFDKPIIRVKQKGKKRCGFLLS